MCILCNRDRKLTAANIREELHAFVEIYCSRILSPDEERAPFFKDDKDWFPLSKILINMVDYNRYTISEELELDGTARKLFDALNAEDYELATALYLDKEHE